MPAKRFFALLSAGKDGAHREKYAFLYELSYVACMTDLPVENRKQWRSHFHEQSLSESEKEDQRWELLQMEKRAEENRARLSKPDRRARAEGFMTILKGTY